MNGPSLLRVPDWVEKPLGADYLYFADHKGDRIKLAYADRLEGPWEIYEPGAIHLRDTLFLQSPPEIPVEIDRASLAAPRGIGVPSILDDVTIPHIASPEVIADDVPERILLSTIDLRGPWEDWKNVGETEVRRPLESWEGADQPLAPSLRSAIDHPVNQLRDPYFFEDSDSYRYLLYATAGESGIAIARLRVSD